MNSKIEVVCHKGANKLAPENTYAAAQICLELGADYIEMDVHTSRDGVLYVFHGPYLERTTNGTGWIGAYTSEELDRLDAGSWFHPRFAGERIPRLTEYLAWIGSRAKVYLDVKNADPRQLADLVHKISFQDRCFIWAKDRQTMLDLHSIAPDLSLKVNIKTVEEARRAKAEFDAHIVEVGADNLASELVGACHRLGMRVMVVYEEDDPAVIRQIMAGGADLINTDYPELCLRLRESG